MEEVWKPVEKYKGIFKNKYQVSNLGKVRNSKGVILKQKHNKYGYPYVGLFNGGLIYSPKVHQLVAEAFLGSKPQGFDVDHIDGNKDNNMVSNLQYISHKANVKKSCDIPVNQYTLEGEFVDRYESITEAAKAFGVVKNAIGNCLKGRRKLCKNFLWDYA